MGMTEAWGSGSEGYSSHGISPWIGWGISTLLLLWMNRKNRTNGDTSNPQPSKFTSDTGNQIGNPIPVVMGRALIKNPLVSFYGDYSYRPYTEEYGMHSKLNVASLIWPILLAIVSMLLTPSKHHATVFTKDGPAEGEAVDIENGLKFDALVSAIISALIALLMWLFNRHAGRTTIQKGFKYYLGWQHILCWTGDNFGLKRIWMNVYDANVEESTEQGVWGSDKIVWKKDNKNGIIAYIDDDEMFGGPDEGGGFIGHIHFYFGTPNQPFDAWMQEQMAQSTNVPSDLKGLTPRYPMFVTCVINNTGVYGGSGGTEVAGGAYIGKQATVPEMWFEVVNYPSTLKDNFKGDLKRLYKDRFNYLVDLVKMVASTEGVPTGAQGAYDSFISQANVFNPNNLAPMKTATNNLLGALDQDLDLYRRVNKVKSLLDHGVWTLGRIGDDCNPAEVICEILINSYWGCHYDTSLDVIDVDSLLTLGGICEEEGLGISCLITSVAQAYDYIGKILTHINGVKYDDPVTGKLTFKLIRADYDVSKLKVFNTTNCESLEFTRLDWSETSSSVSVNFTLADNKYVDAQLVVSDIANPIITGTYSEFNIDGTYFTVAKNARVMAQTQLLSAAYPLSAVNFVCNRYGYDLSIGDPIVVSWEFYGITKQIFRVTDIDYGTLIDGRITVTALEDVFGFDQTDYAFVPSPVWTDPEEDPQDVANYKFLELPYEMAKDLNTYVYAYSAQPSLETVQWYVWRYMGTDYSMRNTSTKWATMGRMVYGLDEKYDDNDMTGFELSYLPNNGEHDLDEKIKAINKDPDIYTKTSGLNLLECNGEIMSYSKIEKLANGHYRIYGLVRGIYDTVPKGHVAYDVVTFLDYGLNINLDKYVCGSGYTSSESVEITTSSITKAQDFDPDKTENFETVRRTECPSIMGNLQFSADRGTFTDYQYNFPTTTAFAHDIKFTFKARNKFNNSSIKGQGDASVDVPATQKNYIKWKIGSDEYEIMYDAYDASSTPTTKEDMTFKWAEFCEKVGNKVRANNEVYLEVGTYNPDKDLYSYDHYEKSIIMLPPVLVGVVENVSDVQAYADSLVENDTTMFIPETIPVTSSFALSYTQAALIFIGTKSSSGDFYSLDGNKYDLSTTAYRIDGATKISSSSDVYEASVHEVTIDESYIFRTNYTGLGADPKYYKIWLGNYQEYMIYDPPI